MKYDGVIARLGENKDLYLFILNPKTKKMMNGLVISEKGYDDLLDNDLMVVDVIFKDGTKEVKDFDIDGFIYESKYNLNDIFLSIKNYLMYHIENTNMTLEEIIKNGNIDEVALHCIKNTKDLKPKRKYKKKDESNK
jgi:hypothetical protein